MVTKIERIRITAVTDMIRTARYELVESIADGVSEVRQAKRCLRGEFKPLDEFKNDPTGLWGRFESCKEHDDYRTTRAYGKKRDLSSVKSYGITEFQYRQMERKQDFCCAICQKPETAKDQNGKTKRLSIDHDHETGKVRKLLCGKCNVVLGMANENIDVLSAAIEYLRSFEPEPEHSFDLYI